MDTRQVTVADLIEKLKAAPQYLPVYYARMENDGGFMGYYLTSVPMDDVDLKCDTGLHIYDDRVVLGGD